MSHYSFNANLRLAHYANRFFMYDARVNQHPLVEIPTQRIEAASYAMLHKLKTQGFFVAPRHQDEIQAYFVEEGLPTGLFPSLIEQHILKPYVSPQEAVEKRVLDFFDARYGTSDTRDRDMMDPPFVEDEANLHIFGTKTFFNLPAEIQPEAAHVGLLGFPHASLMMSLGTESGPDHLRLHSRSATWFDIHDDGIYNEITCNGGPPSIMGQNVVLKDFGNLDFQNMTLAQMLEEVENVLVDSFFAHQVYPLIVGGDHAITYPIMLAYLKQMPTLGLLHLDAHNDLFYSAKTVYSHSSPISNLMKRTSIEQILSFGLRTFSGRRVKNMRALYEQHNAAERVRLYEITTLKQLILTPGLLAQAFDKVPNRPYYLTIDLDVLSDHAIGSQLTTPCGPGLEWYELFYFLDTAFQKLNIIGCDVVEYNRAEGDGCLDHGHMINTLMLLLVDRLGKNNPKFMSQPTSAPRMQPSLAHLDNAVLATNPA